MNAFANLSISVRLAIAFAMAIVLSIVSVSCALVNARDNADSVKRMMALPLVKERITGDWYVHVYAAVARTSMIAKSTDPTLTATFADDIGEDAKQGTALGKQIKDLLTSADEQAIYEGAMQVRAKYLEAKGKIMAARQAGDADTAEAIFRGQFKNSAQLYLKKMLELKRFERNASDDMTRAIAAATERSFNLVVTLVVLLVLLAVAGAVVISRSITVPLKRAIRVAATVANGDLTTAFERPSRDEIGDLMRALLGCAVKRDWQSSGGNQHDRGGVRPDRCRQP